ncbi:MAG: citryl-CoA lyase [Alphaproteobacteria bacterium]|nr:citryl-CoA lyase [Alphaproteobacteria bacterium]
MSRPTTRLCTSTADDVFVRGKSLTRELIGELTFTEAMFFQILGRVPGPAETQMLDACLVTLMEHGLTPTAITARMTYTSAPESMQGAVAAGLASVGSLYVGTMEGCAHLLRRIVRAESPQAEAAAIVAEHREAGARVPGFGHPVHRPDDPRSIKLFELARSLGIAGSHVEAIELLSATIDRESGKHVTINATGAIAAVLSDCDVPAEILRGFALISRCAGLVGHIREEQVEPAMHAMWHGAESAVRHE